MNRSLFAPIAGPARLAAALILATILSAGCGSAGSTGRTPSSAPPVATPSATAAATRSPAPTFANPWLTDLDDLDRHVRAAHPSPFTIHPETDWVAKLAEVGPKLATAANDDERLVLLASVVGLLDTHTYVWRKAGLHAYPVFFYHFAEGWFVIAALDKSLIGTRLVSIGGHPVADVEATLRKLTPHDNDMGFMQNSQPLFSTVEFLHGSGIVSDTAKPQYVFALPDGTERTMDFEIFGEQAWGDALHIVGSLVGDATEAVRRHTELSWARVEKNKVFLLTVNDYGDETGVIGALKAAFDAAKANRVVLDIRFLPGGNGDFALLDVLQGDKRINRPGGLTVLMGRENFSIATRIVRQFDVNTKALLVGEPTPARADNFRCRCDDIDLPGFGLTVTIPTYWDNLGDDRPQIDPDVRMDLSAKDFFAGRDPVLEAALAGIAAP